MTANRTAMRSRIWTYVGVFAALLLGYLFLRDSDWEGSKHLHTIMEIAATLLAFTVGVISLVRFYSRKTNTILFIGCAYLGTAFLDGYHTIVTSEWFDTLMPSPPASLIPWSWNASRSFLAVFMFASWLAWRREERLGKAGLISEKKVYVVSSIAALLSFVFFAFVPLPRAYYPELPFGRPEEFFAALFFLFALVGYLRKGEWKEDALEHWVVLSLIVGFMGQAMFMTHSYKLFDCMFDVAHLLKKVSYVCVLTGLLISMLKLFRTAEESAEEALISSAVLKQEVAEKSLAEAELRKLSKSLEERGEELLIRSDALEKANKELASYKADLERRVDERTAELQENEHKLQLALDALKAGLWSWNIRTNVNHWDAAMHDLFGLEQGTFDGTYEAWAALVHPDDIEAADNALKAALAGGPQYDAIWRTKDQARTGEWRVLRATALVERDEDGEPLQMTGICFDVTEERLADEANQRLATIVTFTDDAIISRSLDGSIQSWNKAAERLYGYGEDEVKGCSINMLIPSENKGEYAANMAKIQKGELVHHHETVRLAKDGTKIDISLTMSPIRDAEGALIGVSAIERDIREIKAHREKLESLVKERSSQLVERNTDLERTNRDLQSLLYVISHDLREPLRSIENFSRMVQNRYAKEIDEKGQDFLQRVVNAAKRLDGLLDDVLMLSRAQRLVQPDETTSLRDIINEAIKRLEGRIKQTEARVEVTGEFPAVVADATWLTQGVYNLIANAVKFTCKGKTPDIDITPYASDNMYGVSVCDRGPGVPEEHRDRIFEMFQRAVGRDIDGTGAGLAIVRQIAERHGGKVWMEPREGGGSRFILAMVNEMDNKITEGEKA